MSERPDDDVAGPEVDPGAGSPTVDDPNQASFLGGAAGATGAAPAAEPAAGGADYRVFARKYRPMTFDQLIGQDAMVRTLTNAFATGRVAHAFILTGVRGIGKTTTARIIAKGLNCNGPDGAGGPTVSPCGVCRTCVDIAQDRHVDVMEMDAASRTGVDDIREILDGVRYRPVAARYKVYIIDEVHMLSRNAFNALLKTLEEPPEHAKFIFATTEVRKVPLTVLSRCQRFDLRRVGEAALAENLAWIAAAEGAVPEPEALRMLVRAADGSVRDGQSLLDQAIAHGTGTITADQVRAMLGLADATQIYDLLDVVMAGEVGAALAQLSALYAAGAEPLVVLQDLTELVHALTRRKIAPAADTAAAVSEGEARRASEMAERLSVPVLTRAWQLLLKGLSEVQAAPIALSAVEMVLVRLAYASTLPPPGELIKRLTEAGEKADRPAAAAEAAPAETAPVETAPVETAPVEAAPPRTALAVGGGAAPPRPVGEPAPLEVPPQATAAPALRTETASAPDPKDFRALVALFGTRREAQLRNHLYTNVHLVAFEPGRLEIRVTEAAPRDLSGQVLRRLRDWCGSHWTVSVAEQPGAPTLAEQDRAAVASRTTAAAQDPVVQAVLAAFPGARIEQVRPLPVAAAPAADPSDDDVDDDDYPGDDR